MTDPFVRLIMLLSVAQPASACYAASIASTVLMLEIVLSYNRTPIIQFAALYDWVTAGIIEEISVEYRP